MRRFFISQHPTFGRGKHVSIKGVEASPYFWWWFAMTLNEKYVDYYVQYESGNRFKTNNRLPSLFAEFGDVRYEGDKHAAFKHWWQTKVNGEERGVYLFAERLQSLKVGLIEGELAAVDAIQNKELLIIQVPLAMKRTSIDNVLDKILKANLVGEKGRVVRNPNRSNARYHLSKPIKVSKYKIAFDMYEAKKRAEAEGENVSNSKLAKVNDLKMPKSTNEELDFASMSRVISTKVSRYLSDAKKAIENTSNGVFP